MFSKTSNIDTAFRHMRGFCICLILANIIIAFFYISGSNARVESAQQRTLILLNGKVIPAVVSTKDDNVDAEAQDHIKTFHEGFFNLSPDEKAIQKSMEKALYLADASAQRQYKDLKENSYFSSIVSGNIQQTISTDSISIDYDQVPYRFRYYGKLTITRPTSTVTRSLCSQGQLRRIARTVNNSHGLLIEKWEITENKDIDIKSR